MGKLKCIIWLVLISNHFLERSNLFSFLLSEEHYGFCGQVLVCTHMGSGSTKGSRKHSKLPNLSVSLARKKNKTNKKPHKANSLSIMLNKLSFQVDCAITK